MTLLFYCVAMWASTTRRPCRTPSVQLTAKHRHSKKTTNGALFQGTSYGKPHAPRTGHATTKGLHTVAQLLNTQKTPHLDGFDIHTTAAVVYTLSARLYPNKGENRPTRCASPLADAMLTPTAPRAKKRASQKSSMCGTATSTHTT